jgi:hypothetical protein
MIRILFLLHRYLGIAVGLLMVMWCVSGVVMMYVSYPALDRAARLKHLAPIDWSGCCKISAALSADTDRVGQSQIEMLAGRPVLNLGNGSKHSLVDLVTGSAVDGVSAEQAAAVAARFTAGNSSAAPRLLGLIKEDQWTVAGAFDADRPLYRFSLGDDSHTELYVSSVTGQAVQITTAHERFWNWLGAVPHWLYFTELRRHPSIWSRVVIFTSLIGCFLAGLGIAIGLLQLARQPAGRWSPYSGFNLWHHMAGLVFGVLALSWVASGLLSMNPWGWLEAAGAQPEIARLRGGPGPKVAQIDAALQRLAGTRPSDVVSMEMAAFGGRLYFIAGTAAGERRRVDALGAAAPLDSADLIFVAGALAGSGPSIEPRLITQADSYYFSHHRDAVSLPVYRLVSPGSGTRYYLDAVSGALIAKMDRNARAYRWLHEGLHRMDFTAPLRARPQWDMLMLCLMSGVTLLCMTGAYLGFRRLTRG